MSTAGRGVVLVFESDSCLWLLERLVELDWIVKRFIQFVPLYYNHYFPDSSDREQILA